MALINCPECSIQVSDKATSCPSCGCPISAGTVQAGQGLSPPVVNLAKSRGIHIILALVFGAVGFHNFYTGYNVRGGIKAGLFLIATVLDGMTGFYTKWSFVLIVIFGLWALAEAALVTTDAQGNRMA